MKANMHMGPKEAEEFWRNVNKCNDEACWEWRGARLKAGYGIVHGRGGAHRVAFSLANGPIPEGAMICHHCDNPPCCNPTHLYAGNAKMNAADMVARGRWRKGRRHKVLERYSVETVEMIRAEIEAGATPLKIHRARDIPFIVIKAATGEEGRLKLLEPRK